MTGSVSARYAFRSLFRHTRRTVLSVIGVGIGCGLGLFGASWNRGATEMQIRAASEGGAGHLRIVPSGWVQTREDTLRLADWEAALQQAESLPNVRAVAIRARTTALLAFGTRTAGVQMTGVDPTRESAANRVVRKAQLEGRYLAPDDPGTVVIGRTLARRLDVEVGDDLYVTLPARDEIHSAMLRIVGTLDTGSRDLNLSICHVHWRDVERMTGYPGPAEISVLLDDHRLIPIRQRELTAAQGTGNEVITWKEVVPELAGNVEGDKTFMKGLLGVILLVVVLGIASAQLTAVLERRRELAILVALGMKGRQVVALVVLEALMIGLVGAAAALLLGGSAAYYVAEKGISLAAIMGENLAFSDVMLDPHFYGDFGPWLIWQALGVSVGATVIASLYPAWLATRIDPVKSLRTV